MAGDRNIDLKPKLLISKNFTMIDLYNSTDVTRSFTRQYKFCRHLKCLDKISQKINLVNGEKLKSKVATSRV